MGSFEVKPDTKIWLSDLNRETEQVATFLSGLFEASAGFRLGYGEGTAGRKGDIHLILDESMTDSEGYELNVNPKQVAIRAKYPVGLFYGVQTLRQLLPSDIESESRIKNQVWSIPSVTIYDAPRFPYRGMHLDVGRHFFPVDFIKKYIDLIALHKMNTFHWHLTEDQGWRLEIKKYPKLTEVSAWRKETMVGHYQDKPRKYDGQRYGGFYTQKEVREIVAYARDRFVTIIPEIEMPGHSQAVLAAYPELACSEGPFEVATSWGVKEDVFCPKEATFTFLENVLSEVMDLFPSAYIHIGGDECPKKRWEESAFVQHLIKKEGLKDENELQSYFIRRMEEFLESKGRKLIGWDEILEGGLSPNATVMSWRGEEGGIEAARQGHDAIMTPVQNCYFDYYQADKKDEPLAIGGFLPLGEVYHYEPIPDGLSAEETNHILGAQGNLWTEYIKTPDYAEYMALPRMTALSEVVWTAKDQKSWKDFTKRLEYFVKRLDKMGVNYAPHMIEK